MILARQHRLEVHLHARLGRAPSETAGRHRGELGLGNEGRDPASSSTATVQGEKRTSSTAKLSSEIGVLRRPKVRITRLRGRLEASRRARVSLS